MQLGAKVVTMSDSTGWIYDAEGLDLDAVKEIKEVAIFPLPGPGAVITTRGRVVLM